MRSISLNVKMGAVIGLLSVGAIVVAGLGLYQLRKTNESLGEITEVHVKSLNEAQKLRALFYLQIINERNFIVNDSSEARKQTLALIEARDAEVRSLVHEREVKANARVLGETSEFMKVYEAWSKTNHEITGLINSGHHKEAMSLVASKGKESRLAGEAVLEKMVASDLAMMKSKQQEAGELYSHARMTNLVVSLGILLLGMGLAGIVLYSVGKSINEVINNLRDNANLVSREAHQISSASENLSEASTEQAASLEQTVASLQELIATAQVNTSHAREASKLSETTRHIAQKGEGEISALLASMGQISADSKKIAEITDVVDDIAFQTNLLALNAAVEAARAGEQGKGFAVVAEAVRALAQRSATAAKDIAGLIQESVEKVNAGSEQAQASREVLEEILSSVKRVAELNGEIATASEGQSMNIEHISKAMSDLDKVTQVNAATSEEAAASAHELSGQSDHLTQTVAVLIATIKGAKATEEGLMEHSLAAKAGEYKGKRLPRAA